MRLSSFYYMVKIMKVLEIQVGNYLLAYKQARNELRRFLVGNRFKTMLLTREAGRIQVSGVCSW